MSISPKGPVRLCGKVAFPVVIFAAILVAAVAQGPAQSLSTPGIHWVIDPPLGRGREFQLVDQYGEGIPYYLDRSYVFVDFHESLAGGWLLRTHNDVKYDSVVAVADRDRWTVKVWVDRPMIVYLLWDRRTLHTVPLWLWNANWELTPIVQRTTDSSMGFFAVLRKILAPGDTLRLGHPMAEGVPTPSMYVLIFKPIGGLGGIPEGYRLGPLYPNPSTASVNVPFELLDRCLVEMFVYDIRGRLVASLPSEIREPGKHRLRWELTDARGIRLPAGVYILEMWASPFWRGTAKMVIVR